MGAGAIIGAVAKVLGSVASKGSSAATKIVGREASKGSGGGGSRTQPAKLIEMPKVSVSTELPSLPMDNKFFGHYEPTIYTQKVKGSGNKAMSKRKDSTSWAKSAKKK